MIIECIKQYYFICRYIRDIEELWLLISYSIKPFDKYAYCKHIKDRKEVWIGLTKQTSFNISWHYWYCKDIKHRKEIWAILENNTARFE